jgi:hypothetical protein
MSMSDELQTTERGVRIKVVSAILAGCGIAWGILLFMLSPAAPSNLILFSGYAITIWYVVRTFSEPPYHVRELMWFLSLVIQGAWLLFGLLGIGNLFGIFTGIWWLFATAASGWALAAEASLTPIPVPIHHDSEKAGPQ